MPPAQILFKTSFVFLSKFWPVNILTTLNVKLCHCNITSFGKFPLNHILGHSKNSSCLTV